MTAYALRRVLYKVHCCCYGFTMGQELTSEIQEMPESKRQIFESLPFHVQEKILRVRCLEKVSLDVAMDMALEQLLADSDTRSAILEAQRQKLDHEAQLLTGDFSATWEELDAASDVIRWKNTFEALTDHQDARVLLGQIAIALMYGKEIPDNIRKYIGHALGEIAFDDRDPQEAFNLKLGRGETDEWQRDLKIAAEVLARAKAGEKKTAIYLDIAQRLGKSEDTIKRAVRRARATAEDMQASNRQRIEAARGSKKRNKS